jgi:hypothetical protein
MGVDWEQKMLIYDLGDWLSEDYLVRFVVDVVDRIVFSQISFTIQYA